MGKYELMMILNPALEKKELDALRKEISQDLTEVGVSVSKEDDWGSTRMAYRIKGSQEGYYIVSIVEAKDPTQLKDVTTPFNVKKDLWRYMFTKVPEGVEPTTKMTSAKKPEKKAEAEK